jgi:hypothetical protein
VEGRGGEMARRSASKMRASGGREEYGRLGWMVRRGARGRDRIRTGSWCVQQFTANGKLKQE